MVRLAGPPEERFPALARLRRVGRKRRRLRFVPQTAANDCGAACLATVLDYHGKEVSTGELRDAAGSGRDGTTAESLLRTAEAYGLRGRAVRLDEPEDLGLLEPGAILHWSFRHFVVLERLDRRGAVIVDPAAGRHHAPWSLLRKAFTGVALTFEPRQGFERGRRRRRGLVRYVRLLAQRSRLVGRLITLSVVLQTMALALPLLTAAVVDRVIPRGDHSLLTLLSTGLAAVVLFNFLTSWIRAHLTLELRTLLDSEVTLEFLDHMVDLPYPFFQQRSAGDLMMRLNSNTVVRETFTSGALSGLFDGILVSLYLVLMFVAHPGMALLALGLGLLRIGLYLATRRRYQALMAESLQAQAASRSYQVEMLAGIETLKALGAERRAVEHWSNLFVDELNVNLARGRLGALFDSLLAALASASPLVILVFGTLQVLAGELTLGTMLAMSALASGFLTPLSALVSTALQLQLMRSYLERIDDVLDTPKEQPDDAETATVGRLDGAIALEEVGFRYAPTLPPAIDGVSATIEPGSFVALVGPSGAGKTTLAHLLLGLYRPTAGRILFDGVDLARLDLRSLRRRIGIVAQQPRLFSGSIRHNIALAEPSLPLARVVEAARLAGIHDEIEAMPMAYDTLLGDGGSSLSGGQMQRIALARALVRRPAILLLDEASSNLDAEAEGRIQGSLERLAATRIVIAHRLSTVRRADQILVMEAARVIERGSHDELMALGGRYSALASAQLGEGAAARAPRSVPEARAAGAARGIH